MSQQTIVEEVKRFIADEFLEGESDELEQASPLLEWGIVDSVGMVKLVAFLEQRFAVRIPQEEVTPKNFRDLSRISELVVRRSSLPPSANAMPSADETLDPEMQELVEFGARRIRTRLTSGAEVHALEIEGPNLTIVLLPEPGEGASCYADMQRAMEGNYRSLAIDLFGFGLSSCPSEAPSFWDQAGLLAEYLSHDSASEYVVIGHGLSGALALELARRLPEKVRGSVLLAYGALPETHPLLAGQTEAATSYLSQRRRVPVAPESALAQLTQSRLNSPAFGAFVNDDVRSYLPSLWEAAGTPTLLIGALQDQIVAAAYLEDAERQKPGTQLKWLARIGHAFPTERADETVSLMAGFLEPLKTGVMA